MQHEPVVVECYAGARYPEQPRSFAWRGRVHRIELVEHTWRSEPPAGGTRLWHARGLTKEGHSFHLVYEEQSDSWYLDRFVERRSSVRKEILHILEKDARTTPKEIATMIGAPEEDVREEIKKLEDEKIILRYGAVVNWEKVTEERPASAVIEVRVAPQRGVGFDDIAARIYRFPEVRSLFLVSGTYDLSVFVEGRTMHDIARFVSEKLATLENVHGTVTHFLLKTYKKDGDVIDDGEDNGRLAFTL